jgi:hypothetical protein
MALVAALEWAVRPLVVDAAGLEVAGEEADGE